MKNIGAILRVIVFVLTVAIVLTLWLWPETVQTKPLEKVVVIPYCIIDQKVAQKKFRLRPNGKLFLDKDGKPVWKWTYEWVKMNGLCSQLDRYENI